MIEDLKLEQPIQKLEDKKKKKPGVWDKVFRKKKLEKSQKVAILYLTKNGQAVPFELEPKNGFFTIRGKSYHEREDCSFVVGKTRIPLAVIHESSIIPEGTDIWKEKDMKEKFLELQTHAMNGIRHAELVKIAGEDRKPMSGKTMIIIGIIVIVGLAIWQGGFI